MKLYQKIMTSLVMTFLLMEGSFAKNIPCDHYIATLSTLKAEARPKNIAEIITILGKAEPTIIEQRDFVWRDFKVLVRDNNIVKVYGNIPPIFQDAITAPSLEEAVMALGKPVEGPAYTLHLYRWTCNAYGSVLSVYTTPENKIISYDGLVCQSNIQNCTAFDTLKFGVKDYKT